MTKKNLILLCLILFLISPLAAKSYIRVNVTNVNASVYIDDVFKGTSPVYAEVTPGTHSVRVEKKYYKTYKGSVSVVDGAESSVVVALEEECGTIKAYSNIDGASVYLDGVYKGITPLTLHDLEPGRYKLRFKKDNYDDVVQIVYVSAGKTTHFTAHFIGASLTVTANQDNVTVYIDNVKKGTVGRTPLTINDIEPGYHHVELAKKHYRSSKKEIEFFAGNTHYMTGVLEKISGYLKVETEPENAHVTVSGNSITYLGENLFEVNPGSCNVKVRAFGYNDKMETSSVSTDNTTNLKVELEEAEFDIKSLSVSSSSFNPDNTKVLPDVRIEWGVTAPEKGLLTIRDSKNDVVASWDIVFADWRGSVVWNGKENGISVDEGLYQIELEAGGKCKTASVTVDKSINNFLQVSRAGEGGVSLGFDFSLIFSEFYSGRDYGFYCYCGNQHFYYGLGCDIYSVDYPSYSKYHDDVFYTMDFRAGMSFNYFSLRPYLQGGVGFHSYNEKELSNFFFSLTAGFDVFGDNYQAGLFYTFKNFVNYNTASCIGLSLGLCF